MIHFATTNDRKFQSLKRDLDNYDISVVQNPLELVEPRSSEVREIAEAKVKQAYPEIQEPTIVMDAGFYIDPLNGFPRAFVNFSLDTIGLEGILKLMEGKEGSSRGCEFRECLAYMDESLGEPKYFFSHVRGQLAEKKRGSRDEHLWSRLGYIFIPEGSDKTLAEMSQEEYSVWRKISRQRNSPGRKLGEWLVSRHLTPH